ncbi:MAG: hypothetical protein ACFFD3_10835 [Candidatus Thorarchaeota archaeon]
MTVKPELVKILAAAQMDLVMEHIEILRELITQNLTVKEIHRLFWDPKEKKYTKTLKTVYRYMDILEAAELVRVAGHRKPADSRMTEKLYCRSAMIFTAQDDDKSPKWYETAEGQEELRNTAQLVLQFFGIDENRSSDFEKLLKTYYSARDEVVKELLNEISKNERLAETMVRIGIQEFKSVASLLGMFGVLRNLSNFQKDVLSVLSEH